MSKRRYGVSESPSNIPPTEAALLKTLVDKIQYIQYAPESHAEADKRHRRGICNDMFSMVRIFHEEGAIDISRAGILHFFVYHCIVDFYEKLVKLDNTQINAKDFSGKTPLMTASRRKESEDRQLASIQKLLSLGADKNLLHDGVSALGCYYERLQEQQYNIEFNYPLDEMSEKIQVLLMPADGPSENDEKLFATFRDQYDRVSSLRKQGGT